LIAIPIRSGLQVVQGCHSWVSENERGRRKSALDLHQHVVNAIAILTPARVNMPPNKNDFPTFDFMKAQPSPNSVEIGKLLLSEHSDSNQARATTRRDDLQISNDMSLRVRIERQVDL
jgi:hypothetical protein